MSLRDATPPGKEERRDVSAVLASYFVPFYRGVRVSDRGVRTPLQGESVLTTRG